MIRPATLVALAGLVTAGGNAVIGQDEVTSRSVKDRSLLLADFERSARDALRGTRGPEGLSGRPGVSGVGQVFRKSEVVAVPVAPQEMCPMPPGPQLRLSCFVPRSVFTTGTVSCDRGEVAVDGGVSLEDPVTMDVAASYPNADGTGWIATAGNDDISRPHSFTVFVLCVRGQAMTSAG